MTQSKTYRILLVDDQQEMHDTYRRILGSAEPQADAPATVLPGCDPAAGGHAEVTFELDSAYQGQQGFELVQRSIEAGRPYALAFIDIRMPPGWDGVQTVRRIWEIDPEILIVICSGYSDFCLEDIVHELGRNDRFLILKKPFDDIEVRQCALAMAQRWSVSRTDVLTGLLNRRAFHGHFDLEWGRSARYDFPLACAMIDLDYFKRVNDTVGHLAGDVVLRQVARLVQANCRASDYVCRYGGEELCVLLPHTTEQGAAAWAEHTRGVIESTAVVIGDRAIRATASFGIGERMAEPDDVRQLIDRADQALMVAKKLGANRVVPFSAISDLNSEQLEEVGRRRNLFRGVTARQVMTAPVACLPISATAGEAANFFLQFRINSAPVVDGDGKLVGILSEKDVVGILLNEDAWTVPAERIMQRSVVCYEEEAPLQAICEFLSRVALRRVVIVRDGCPTGVVSRGSLLRWYANTIGAQDGSTPSTGNATHVVRGRMIEGVQAVAHCAVELSQTVSTYTEDLLPPVIDGVSKLQELIDDLLACSRPNNLPGAAGQGTAADFGWMDSGSALVD